MEEHIVDLNTLLTPQVIELLEECNESAEEDGSIERAQAILDKLAASVANEDLCVAVTTTLGYAVALLVYYKALAEEQDPTRRSEDTFARRFEIPPEETQ